MMLQSNLCKTCDVNRVVAKLPTDRPAPNTFSYKLVISLVLNQDNKLYPISLSILTTCLLDDVWILQRKSTF